MHPEAGADAISRAGTMGKPSGPGRGTRNARQKITSQQATPGAPGWRQLDLRILDAGPGRRRPPAGHRPEPAMTGAVLTVSIWHNITRDADGRSTGYDGYRAGDEMARVFTYDIPADGRDLARIAEDTYAIGNAAPGLMGRAAALAARYAQRQLRSVSVGDVVVIGEAALTVARAGWLPLPGPFTPCAAPSPAPAPSGGPAAGQHAGPSLATRPSPRGGQPGPQAAGSPRRATGDAPARSDQLGLGWPVSWVDLRERPTASPDPGSGAAGPTRT